MKSINWLGVIVATVVAFFVGFLWYGLLFEAEWKSLTGVTGEGGDPMWMLLGVVQTFITMAGLGWFISRTEGGWMGGAKIGLIACVCFADGFLMFCASSRQTRHHSTAARSSRSRCARA